jgi:hypothetical protein
VQADVVAICGSGNYLKSAYGNIVPICILMSGSEFLRLGVTLYVALS